MQFFICFLQQKRSSTEAALPTFSVWQQEALGVSCLFSFTFQWSKPQPSASMGGLREAGDNSESLYLYILDTPPDLLQGTWSPEGDFHQSIHEHSSNQTLQVRGQQLLSIMCSFWVIRQILTSISDLVYHSFPLSKNYTAPEAGTLPLTILLSLDMYAPLSNPDVRCLPLMPHSRKGHQSTTLFFTMSPSGETTHFTQRMACFSWNCHCFYFCNFQTRQAEEASFRF